MENTNAQTNLASINGHRRETIPLGTALIQTPHRQITPSKLSKKMTPKNIPLISKKNLSLVD